MEKLIKSLKSWKENLEREIENIDGSIKSYQKTIADRQSKRLDVEKDIEELRKAIVLLEAHKGAVVL